MDLIGKPVIVVLKVDVEYRGIFKTHGNLRCSSINLIAHFKIMSHFPDEIEYSEKYNFI